MLFYFRSGTLFTCLCFIKFLTLSPRKWQNKQNPPSFSELFMFFKSSFTQLLEYIKHANTYIHDKSHLSYRYKHSSHSFYLLLFFQMQTITLRFSIQKHPLHESNQYYTSNQHSISSLS